MNLLAMMGPDLRNGIRSISRSRAASELAAPVKRTKNRQQKTTENEEMSIKTKIQWCDSTVNPIMGCDGCQLFPKPATVQLDLAAALAEDGIPKEKAKKEKAKKVIKAVIGEEILTDTFHRRLRRGKEIIQGLGHEACQPVCHGSSWLQRNACLQEGSSAWPR